MQLKNADDSWIANKRGSSDRRTFWTRDENSSAAASRLKRQNDFGAAQCGGARLAVSSMAFAALSARIEVVRVVAGV